MSAFPRIDSDHPLTQAARETNAWAEREGLEAAINNSDMNIGVGELAYLAEQRALRAVAAAQGENLGTNPFADEQVARRIIDSQLWNDMRLLLIGAYMDGLTIGFRAAQISLSETP